MANRLTTDVRKLQILPKATAPTADPCPPEALALTGVVDGRCLPPEALALKGVVHFFTGGFPSRGEPAMNASGRYLGIGSTAPVV